MHTLNVLMLLYMFLLICFVHTNSISSVHHSNSSIGIVIFKFLYLIIALRISVPPMAGDMCNRTCACPLKIALPTLLLTVQSHLSNVSLLYLVFRSPSLWLMLYQIFRHVWYLGYWGLQRTCNSIQFRAVTRVQTSTPEMFRLHAIFLRL